MKLASKLRLGILALALAAVGSAVISAYALQSIGRERERLTDAALPRMLALTDLDEISFGLLATAQHFDVILAAPELAERGPDIPTLTLGAMRYAEGVAALAEDLPQGQAQALRAGAAALDDRLSALLKARDTVEAASGRANARLDAIAEATDALDRMIDAWREEMRRDDLADPPPAPPPSAPTRRCSPRARPSTRRRP